MTPLDDRPDANRHPQTDADEIYVVALGNGGVAYWDRDASDRAWISDKDPLDLRCWA